MESLTLSSIVVRGSEHLETELAGQSIMLSPAFGKYFAVEATAKRIWDMVSEPTSLRDVVIALLDEFEVDPARCEREVLAFAETLRQNGLIDIRTA